MRNFGFNKKNLGKAIGIFSLLSITGIFGIQKGFCLEIKYFEEESKNLLGGINEIVALKGELFIGTSGRGIFVFDPDTETFRDFEKNKELPSQTIVSLAVLGDTLLIGTEEGLSVYDGTILDVIYEVQNVTMRKTYVGADNSGKTAYAASLYLAGGLVKNDSSGWQFIGGEGRGLFNDVNSFAFMEGRAFFGSIRGTIFVFDGVSIERATDTFLPANIFSLAAGESRIYVGTGRGLYAVENKKWEKVGLAGRHDSSAIFDIFTGDGYIILGTKDGIVKFGAGGAESLTKANGLPFNRVNAVLMHQGTIYAGTPAGLVEIKGW